jgi:hypothetical protein
MAQSLDHLADSLPNGFHDAQLKAIAIDYTALEARLSLNILVGDPDAVTEEDREAYRSAEVRLSGLIYFVIEAPDARYPYDNPGTLRIDVSRMQELTGPLSVSLPPLPETAFANWLFVNDWNAFIYVAARTAQFEWLDTRSTFKIGISD